MWLDDDEDDGELVIHDFLNDLGGDGDDDVVDNGGVGGDDDAGEDEVSSDDDEDDEDLFWRFKSFVCSRLSQSSDW